MTRTRPRAPLASLVFSITLSACASVVAVGEPVDAPADALVDASIDVVVASDLAITDGTTADDRGAGADHVLPPADAVLLDQPPSTGGVRCGEALCASGESCCLMSGRCFDPRTHPEQCLRPPQDGDDRRTCASHADCAAAEFCLPSASLACFGAGHCQPRSNCATCMGAGDVCAVCGCDGRDYPNVQSACMAGVRVLGTPGRCGAVPAPGDRRDASTRADPARIPCAHQAQCPTGQGCCAETGVCFDTRCATCCRPPPAGTDFPCSRDEECFPTQYCAGDGCGTPGGCVSIRGTGECSGIVTQVCGCDGRTYINECWATRSGIRVAATGACRAM